MGEIEEVRETQRPRDGSTSSPSSSDKTDIPAGPGMHVAQPEKKTFWQRVKEPGSVWQIIFAALLAIAIGLIVTTQVENIHPAAIAITAIPGTLWLRALRAVVLPMIVTAMIMAIQRLRAMTQGGGKAGKLARWTIGYYVITTIIAVAHSCILVGLVWSKLMQTVSGDQLEVAEDDQETIDERKDVAIHAVVVDMFNSLVPQNIVDALATDSLLAVLVTAVVIGYVIKPGGALMRAVEEVEVMIMRIITVLIYLAPIGVFFLIMPNLFRLDIAEIGLNLGVLIGGTLVGMVLHLFIIIPIIFFCITRRNPYTLWIRCSPAWITAWGTASSAATLPVTIRCVLEQGVPVTVTKFAVPLGCLINMDGTAIYFPIVVVFLAATQGITLNAADYIVVVLLSTLASIGTTPIPSSSLVLTVMIASSVGIPITGMYAVVVAIDWFLDRFRTAVNVSCDTFAAVIVTKITGIRDEEGEAEAYTEELNNGPQLRDDVKV
ncbi:amino acid transporter [Parastagonospora nodorum]|nr:amino acid transporter [Parastagonospora nodorum]KAH4053032.1 amino acid transporter [Parastagonospora nodorum]KAH4068617.1 amino acid transporter [Parastagonospora nodorum]KAH4100208.1 amino acid transporter [Parastagonospora nodorum]KAH4190563.1 amino acid transporter [Parastagonospora nodorum]